VVVELEFELGLESVLELEPALELGLVPELELESQELDLEPAHYQSELVFVGLGHLELEALEASEYHRSPYPEVHSVSLVPDRHLASAASLSLANRHYLSPD
jgi:hypothetical protein